MLSFLAKQLAIFRRRYETAQVRVSNCRARLEHFYIKENGRRYCPNCGESQFITSAFGVRRLGEI